MGQGLEGLLVTSPGASAQRGFRTMHTPFASRTTDVDAANLNQRGRCQRALSACKLFAVLHGSCQNATCMMLTPLFCARLQWIQQTLSQRGRCALVLPASCESPAPGQADASLVSALMHNA